MRCGEHRDSTTQSPSVNPIRGRRSLQGDTIARPAGTSIRARTTVYKRE